MRKTYLVLLCFLTTIFTATAQELRSPDGNFLLAFALNNEGIPVYKLLFKGKPVLLDSKMGFIISAKEPFSDHFAVTDTLRKSNDDTWQPVWGQKKDIRDHYNELLVSLQQENTGRKLNVRFRLFNDGLGFRYEFPLQDNLLHFVIKNELTEFNLGQDAKAFWLPGDYDSNEYPTTTSKLSEISSLIGHAQQEKLAARSQPAGVVVQTPLMLKSDNGLYINIHEAALVNYPAMLLQVEDKKFMLRSNLAPDYQGNSAYVQTGSVTPWRTVIVSDDARNILASDLILNLNEPCAIVNTSWIKPTKFVGVWWEYFTGGGSTWAYADYQGIEIGKTDYTKLQPNGHHGANTAHVKEYIDFAAANGFDAVLVEGWNEGWEDNVANSKETIYSFVKAYPDFDVAELHRYAASKGIKLIMHHETTSAVGDYERNLDTAFRFMKKNGYDAVKTGYVGYIIPRGVHHDGQYMVNHYNYVAKKAAEYEIMIDSHEAVRPTGLCRTWPNWLAQESARGTEFESFSGINPDHTTILPFTRLMGGPMDYTPGIFEGDLSVYGKKTRKLSSTLVKQLALYVTMYSPLQMAADLPENYKKFPDAFQFIRDVAVDWDATYILEAEPGDYVTIARKAKNKNAWFIGGITDENAREAMIKFDFLPAGRKYSATVYADGATANWLSNPKSYVIKTISVNSKTVLKQKLAPGGGVAISVKE